MFSWLRLPGREASLKPLASEPEGLEAFASEDVVRPDLSLAAEPHPAGNMRFVVGFLVLLVAVQAYPSALWLRGGLRRTADPIAKSALSDASLAAAAAPASPVACAPAPVTTAAAGPSATSARAPTPRPTPPAAGPSAAAAAAPVTPPQMLAGMLTVSAPVPLRLFVKGRLVGTTEAESTMLPQGSHEIEFLNEAVGFRARRTVAIRAGATSAIKLDAPPGTLHINAVPWAEVWIDGERIGETPIGNLPVRIGTREVVFKHPELGERRTSVLVTLKEPVRISMDLRKK